MKLLCAYGTRLMSASVDDKTQTHKQLSHQLILDHAFQSLTFLCRQLADIHRFVENFDGQSQRRRQRHLSLFVVLLQHGHRSLRQNGQLVKHHVWNKGRKNDPCGSDLCISTESCGSNMPMQIHTSLILYRLVNRLRIVVNLQHCCCRYRLPSSLHSCRSGHSGTAGSRSVCPSPCTAKRRRKASYLWWGITQKLQGRITPTCRASCWNTL